MLDVTASHCCLLAVACHCCACTEAARVGGARTIAELSGTLLAARYDVRSLSTVELMRWDYKEATRPLGGGGGGGSNAGGGMGGGMRVGIAAICETVPELMARSGGAAGLEAAMVEASERRGGLGVLLAVTKEDGAKDGAKGLVALLPAPSNGEGMEEGVGREGEGMEEGEGREGESSERTDAVVNAAAALLEAISGVPRLPSALATNQLFQAQRIEAEGFGIRWERVEGAPRLRVSSLRAAATRKTLMPAVLQLG